MWQATVSRLLGLGERPMQPVPMDGGGFARISASLRDFSCEILTGAKGCAGVVSEGEDMPKYQMYFDTISGETKYNVDIDENEPLQDVLDEILFELRERGEMLHGDG